MLGYQRSSVFSPKVLFLLQDKERGTGEHGSVLYFTSRCRVQEAGKGRVLP